MRRAQIDMNPVEVSGLAELWFDADCTPRIIVGRQLEILATNPSADRVLGHGGSVANRDGYLTTPHRRSATDLAALVAGLQPGRGRSLVIGCGTDGETLLRVQALEGGEGPIGVSIRELSVQIEYPDFEKLFGLTRAESQALVLMTQGASSKEIALRLNKSILTIRTHIKRAYAKLGVKHREQLFSRVLRMLFIP